MNSRYLSVALVFPCLVFTARLAGAACPTTLVDTLVPSTSWGSPNEAPFGISLDSSYRVLGTEYVLSAVNPQNGQPVTLYRFYGNTHQPTQDNPVQTANTSDFTENIFVDTAAVYFDNAVNWATEWLGLSDSLGTFPVSYRRFLNTMVARTPAEETVFPTSGYLSQDFGSIDAIYGISRFVQGALAYPPGGSRVRPLIRIISAGGTEVFPPTVIESSSYWDVFDMHVDSFQSTSYGSLIVITWAETYSLNNVTRIRFRVLNADGSDRGVSGTINPSSGYRLSKPRVAGIGNNIMIVWNSIAINGSELSASSYMQGFDVGAGSSLFSKRLVYPSGTYSSYMPDVSASYWVSPTGAGYYVYSISYYTVITDCGSTTGKCLYPTVHLFKSFSQPVDVTGPQYLSWYPQSNFNTVTDGVRNEVFTGCTNEVIVGGVFYADSNINPSTQRGLRRSFFSISSASMVAALTNNSSTSSMFEDELSDFYGMTESDILLGNPFAGLESGGYLISNLLDDSVGELSNGLE